MNGPTCAISIATHNRLPELQRTLGVVAGLQPQPDEILICADGCTDGTADFIREHCPKARLIENRGTMLNVVLTPKARVNLLQAAEVVRTDPLLFLSQFKVEAKTDR